MSNPDHCGHLVFGWVYLAAGRGGDTAGYVETNLSYAGRERTPVSFLAERFRVLARPCGLEGVADRGDADRDRAVAAPHAIQAELLEPRLLRRHRADGRSGAVDPGRPLRAARRRQP